MQKRGREGGIQNRVPRPIPGSSSLTTFDSQLSTVDFPPCYIPISLAMENAMPIPQELLDILVCPVCKTPVKLAPDNSSLKCQSSTCRRVYPVRDDIPVMLPEEAKIAPE